MGQIFTGENMPKLIWACLSLGEISSYLNLVKIKELYLVINKKLIKEENALTFKNE